MTEATRNLLEQHFDTAFVVPDGIVRLTELILTLAMQAPYTLTPAIVNLVAEIGETIGRYTVLAEHNLTSHLRRENRIRTIQASLAIENNTLTLEQVTAVIEGKRVLGHPREIQEVRNAFATYEAMED